MESHKIWIAKLQDTLRAHIYNGLKVTLADVKGLSGGHTSSLAPSVQVAMEGIPYIGSHILKVDYNILLEGLRAANKTEQEFNDIILKAYHGTAINAMKNAGLECDNFNLDYINGATGMEFVHQVYINTGRYIWYEPDILLREKNISNVIDKGVEKSICDGIDLNKLIKAVQYGARSTVGLERPKRSYPKTAQQKINDLPTAKTILDSDSESEDELDQAQKLLNTTSQSRSTARCSMPPKPMLYDEETIDDDALAPDNMTIASETIYNPNPSPSPNQSLSLNLSPSPNQSLEVNESLKSSKTDTTVHAAEAVVGDDDSLIIPVIVNHNEAQLMNNIQHRHHEDDMPEEEEEEDEEDIITVRLTNSTRTPARSRRHRVPKPQPQSPPSNDDDMATIRTAALSLNTNSMRKDVSSRRRRVPKPRYSSEQDGGSSEIDLSEIDGLSFHTFQTIKTQPIQTVQPVRSVRTPQSKIEVGEMDELDIEIDEPFTKVIRAQTSRGPVYNVELITPEEELSSRISLLMN